MKMTGNTISATRRGRSRSSFRKARVAGLGGAPGSGGALPHDREVRVLQRGRVRLDDRQRRLDRAQDLVRAHGVELDAEERRLAEGDPARAELLTQPRAIVRVDEQVLSGERG